MVQKILLFCFFFLGNTIFFAQATDKKTLPKTVDKIATPIIDLSDELKPQVSDYLVQNVSLSLGLNSEENRISFLLKTANLLWKLDKQQSRAVFRAASEDLRKIVIETDFQMEELEKLPDFDISRLVLQKSIWLKLTKINNLSQSMSQLLIDTDPALGYKFFENLKSSVKNKQLQQNFNRTISSLQTELLNKAAETSIDKALKVAKKRLKEEGFFNDSVELLQIVMKEEQKNVLDKELKKSHEFARLILESLSSSKTKRQYFSSLQKLLQIGKTNLDYVQKSNSGRKPIMTQPELDDLSELIDYFLYNPSTTENNAKTIDLIREFAPARKFKDANDSIKQRGKTPVIHLNDRFGGVNDLRTVFLNELDSTLVPIYQKSIRPTEKKQIIEEVMRKVALIKDHEFHFEALIWFAGKVVKAKEKETAAEILNEAKFLIKTLPTDSTDFANNWLLAESWFEIDENKSFEIIENIFTQLNQIINAYAVYNEYVTGNLTVEDNEVKIESVGNAKIIGLENLKLPFIKKLAEKDFPRLANLANRLDRSEFRLETRIMICRVLLETPVKTANK
jgi:hypothetical protein